MQRGGRFCVERVKFVKFWERDGGGVRSYEWIGRQMGDGAAAEGQAKPLRPRRLGQLPCEGSLFAGCARENSLPCQREVPSASEAEGFLAVCWGNGRPRKARRNPPVT